MITKLWHDDDDDDGDDDDDDDHSGRSLTLCKNETWLTAWPGKMRDPWEGGGGGREQVTGQFVMRGQPG